MPPLSRSAGLTLTQTHDMRETLRVAVRIFEQVLEAADVSHEHLAQMALAGAAVNDAALALMGPGDGVPTTSGELH